MPIEVAATGFGTSFPSGCQPGMVRLNAHVAEKFGGTSLGCYSATSRLSSGRWSWHRYGKALDRGFNWFDPAQRKQGNALFDWYVANRAALGTQQVIFGERIWDIEYGERIYRHDDHKNHVHAAFGYMASQHWTPTSIEPEDDDDMDELQLQRFIGGIQDGEKYAANMVINALRPLLDGVEGLLAQSNAQLAASHAELVKVRQETAAVKRLLAEGSGG